MKQLAVFYNKNGKIMDVPFDIMSSKFGEVASPKLVAVGFNDNPDDMYNNIHCIATPGKKLDWENNDKWIFNKLQIFKLKFSHVVKHEPELVFEGTEFENMTTKYWDVCFNVELYISGNYDEVISLGFPHIFTTSKDGYFSAPVDIELPKFK